MVYFYFLFVADKQINKLKRMINLKLIKNRKEYDEENLTEKEKEREKRNEITVFEITN